MSGPIFNKDLCVGCGLCASVCSMISLKAKGKGNLPEMVFPDICLKCGHCISVCPNNAVSHPELNMSNFKPIGQIPDSGAVRMLLSTKRSVREFLKKPLEKEVIEEIITTACMSSTDMNSQKNRFIVLLNQDKIKELEYAIVEGFKMYVKSVLELNKFDNSPEVIFSQNIIIQYNNGGSPIFQNAPCVLFICGPKQNIFAPTNAVMTNTYLTIQAHSMGIGSCFIGRALYNTEYLAKYLEISEDLDIYTAITLGYPKVKYRKIVDRKPYDVKWI